MDYPDVKAQETLVEASYISRAHANAQVYALAEKYDIEGLKVLARTKFDAAMVAEFDPVPLTSPPDMTHLIAILSLVYNSTPGSDRVLRDRVIGHMWKHWKRLTPEPEFHALIAANPELMIEAVNNMFGQQLQ